MLRDALGLVMGAALFGGAGAALLGGSLMVRDVAMGVLLAAATIGALSVLPGREYVPRWHAPDGTVVTLDSLQVVAVPPRDGVVLAVPVGWFGGVPYWCQGGGWLEVDPAGPCVIADGRELRGYCDVELSSPDYTVTHGAPPLCE